MTDERRFTELFAEAVDRNRFQGKLAPPILSLCGTPGAGLEVLLKDLSETMSQRAPWARLRGDNFPVDRGSLPVTLSVANKLSRPIPKFGELATPRFLLGFLVTRAPLPDHTEGQRRTEVIRRTLNDRRQYRDWIQLLVKALTETATVGAGDRLGDLFAFATDAAFVSANTALEEHAPARQWYKTALGHGDHLDPTSALVDLSDQVTTDPETVDRVLCRALLADLRAAYRPQPLRFFARNTCCAVLIGGADSPAVQTFLATVAQEREHIPWDPLAIVTTATRREPGATAATRVSGASLTDWALRRPLQARYHLAWEQSAPVDPFDGPADFRPGPAFAEALAPSLHRAEREMVTMVRRATGEHPKGIDLVLRGLHDEDRRGYSGDPRDILTRDVDGKPLDEIITDELVGFGGDRMRDIGAQVVYLAMARDAGDTNLNRVIRSAPPDEPDHLLAFRDRSPWVEFPNAGKPDRPPALHPLARRAIAHRLGRHAGWLNLVWAGVHNRLGAVAGDDRMTRLYHDLAAGRVGHVAGALDRALDELDMPQWFDALRQVTSAPVRDPAAEHSAEANCTLLAGDRVTSESRADGGDPRQQRDSEGRRTGSRVTPTLVAALQLHTDPLGDPCHQLCALIARELRGLSGRVDHDAVFVLRRAAEFGDCSTRWR
jgi:hypothetical protein